MIVALNQWRDRPKRTEKTFFGHPNFNPTHGSAAPLARFAA
jgi:hypothetical protein